MRVTDFRAVCFPYLIKKQYDNKYIVLNRDYKPLGFISNNWVNYDSYPISYSLKITKPMVKKLSINQSDNDEEIFLYNDEFNPNRNEKSMISYLEKLKLLSKIKIEF